MTEATPELVAGAHAAFADAVHDLIGLRPDTIERDDYTQQIVRDSLYTELCDAKMGERSTSTAGGGGKPGAPGSIDALSLIVRIDKAVARWWPHVPPAPADQPVTVRRLYALVDYQWSPHEIGQLRGMTRTVQSWVTRARRLLPTQIEHEYELKAACPTCGETYVTTDDGSGELVRRYALVAKLSSAACAACGMVWAPEYFAMLGQMIGAGLPPGVLD